MKLFFLIVTFIFIYPSISQRVDSLAIFIDSVRLIKIIDVDSTSDYGYKVTLFSEKNRSIEMSQSVAREIISNIQFFRLCSMVDFASVFGLPNYSECGFTYEHFYSPDGSYNGCWLQLECWSGIIAHAHIECH